MVSCYCFVVVGDVGSLGIVDGPWLFVHMVHLKDLYSAFVVGIYFQNEGWWDGSAVYG